MKKLLIIGQGFLGSYLSNVAKTKKFQVFQGSFSNHIKIDIRNIESIENIVRKIKPDLIINCAALTDINNIEKNSKNAYQVNAYGAENISKITSKYSKRLIHISTDSVFDGKRGNYRENDKPNPINEYSKSKKLGEDLIKENLDDYVIVRTNFYGNHNKKKFLFNWIIENYKQNKKFDGFTNIFFNPLEIENLSLSLLELSELEYTGILHMGSNKTYSKYEFAKIIGEKLEYNYELLSKKEVKDEELIAKRPHNPTLSNELSKKIIKNPFYNLETWLEKIKGENRNY